MEERKKEIKDRGEVAGWLELFSWGYIPQGVPRTDLGLGLIRALLQMEEFSKRRKEQFKFPKLTLDGVWLSQ